MLFLWGLFPSGVVWFTVQMSDKWELEPSLVSQGPIVVSASQRASPPSLPARCLCSHFIFVPYDFSMHPVLKA